MHTYQVRHSLIFPACQIAKGKRVAIAPRVLCHLYKGLNDMATSDLGLFQSDTYMPAHFLIGWLHLYFPWVSGVEEPSEADTSGILLGRFADRGMANPGFEQTTKRLLRLHQFSREMYRLPPTADLGPSTIGASESLTPRLADYLASLHPCLVLSREGSRFFVEPYFPHRFARQFGFAQDVPHPLLNISRLAREPGTGPGWWHALWLRFTEPRRQCSCYFPLVFREVHTTYDYVWWYNSNAWKICTKMLHRRLFPLGEEVPYALGKLKSLFYVMSLYC